MSADLFQLTAVHVLLLRICFSLYSSLKGGDCVSVVPRALQASGARQPNIHLLCGVSEGLT